MGGGTVVKERMTVYVFVRHPIKFQKKGETPARVGGDSKIFCYIIYFSACVSQFHTPPNEKRRHYSFKETR